MKTKQLEILANQWESCTKCELSQVRIKSVFGRGSVNAKLVLIGQNPGKNENEQGIPFIGTTGKILDKLLEEVGLTTNDYYILNACLCHSPKNRKPTSEEVTACRPRLLEQLTIISPQIIVTLGASATESFLNDKSSISKIRGKFQFHAGYSVMPTYHPSSTIYTPKNRDILKEDLQTVATLLIEGF